jgi:hypothetical protein
MWPLLPTAMLAMALFSVYLCYRTQELFYFELAVNKKDEGGK